MGTIHMGVYMGTLHYSIIMMLYFLQINCTHPKGMGEAVGEMGTRLAWLWSMTTIVRQPFLN